MHKKPKHIAIIMDGNRRFGKKIGKKIMGHVHGIDKIKDLLNWCKEFKISELTLYTFSIENFNRNKNEVNFLMKLFREQLKKINEDQRVMNEKININFIGKLELFPDDIKNIMTDLMEKTKHHNQFKINFAMGYSGRKEIIDATKKIVEKVLNGEILSDKIDEKIFTENLYLKNEPDMVIRTGGDKRLSNFLIWQSNYSELFFLDKLWPEFSKEDFESCINEFKKRDRRFGK